MAQSFRPNCQIIYVNDNSDDQLVFQRAVASTGTPFQVRSFFSGQPALAFLAYLKLQPISTDRDHQAQPAFVLCDYNLRSGKGSDLVSAMRFIPSCASLPMIMWSGWHTQRSIALCYAAGANYFLSKPATQARLEIIVNALYGCATLDPPNFAGLSRLPEYQQCPETATFAFAWIKEQL